jgi:hypothetical protein
LELISSPIFVVRERGRARNRVSGAVAGAAQHPSYFDVISAKAGIHLSAELVRGKMDPDFRRGDARRRFVS